MPTIQERFKTLTAFGSGRRKRIAAMLNLTDEDARALSLNPNADVLSGSVEMGSAYRGDYSDQAEYEAGDIVTLNHVGYVLDDPGETIPTPGTGDGAIEDGDEYPAAAAQATAFGKTIAVLGRADDEVFLGYGDYDTNSGPVDIGLIDVSDLTAEPTTALAAVQTEQIILFRRLSDGRVLAPAVDARGTTGGHYAERSSGGAWVERLDRISTLALHVFDLVEGPGGVLFACGSAFEGPAESGDSGAAIWKSVDAGATWTLDYSIFDANVAESHRFNWLAVVGDTVYARSHQTGGGAAGETLEWTAAGGWVASAHPLPVNLGPGQPFRDGYVLPGGHWGYSDMRGALRYFDGTTATTLHPTVAGFDVGDDGALYYVTTTGILKRIAADGDDLASETLAETGDTDLRGMVVVPGEEMFVFGGDAAHVRVYDLTQRDPWRPLAPDVLDPATGRISQDALPAAPPIPGVTAPLEFFKLDDVFTPAAGFRLPTVGGVDGYDNGDTCYVTGSEAVLSGDVYRDASVAIVANNNVPMGTITDAAYRPPAGTTWLRQGGDLWVGSTRVQAYLSIGSDGSVSMVSTAAMAAAADGYFGLAGVRYPIEPA